MKTTLTSNKKFELTGFIQTKYGILLKAENIKGIVADTADYHTHLRRDGASDMIIPYIDGQFSIAYAMPNVQIKEVGDPDVMGIVSYEKLVWYRNHILAKHKKTRLKILFSYYLSDDLSVEDIRRAWNEQIIDGIKYYPQGGTTNSENGLVGFTKVKKQLELMQELGIPLNIHGEIPSKDGKKPVYGKEREPLFYSPQGEAEKLLSWYTGPVVCEHITTITAVEFVKKYDNVVATMTPQHLMFNEHALQHKALVNNFWYRLAIQMGLLVSMMCMPVLKSQRNVVALRKALIWQYKTGAKKFFLGTDTAWHPKESKCAEVCACGVWNSPMALVMYYMVFRYMDRYMCKGIIEDFQRFASDIGRDFYKTKEESYFSKIICIAQISNEIPKDYDGIVSPFAGQIMPFRAFDVTDCF